jgi:TolB protein
MALGIVGAAYAQTVHQLEVGEILFTSTQNGNYDIYAMNSDGSDLRPLTDSPADDTNPSWSPDGASVLFISDRDGSSDVFIMNSDGSEPRPLTRTDADEVAAAWSPDGTQIVFARGDSEISPLQGGTAQLFILTLATGEETQITDAEALHNAPAWSPDGEWIAYVSDADGTPQIYKQHIADGTVVRMTNVEGATSFNPAWSPNGAWLAYDSLLDGNRDIYVMDSDGERLRRVTDDPAVDMQPVWTFDGTRLMFASDRVGNMNLYRTDSFGRGIVRLTTGEGVQAEPFCLWAGG